jgi:hydroxymethylpyrimidine/phosphomethylpyrimidine kinase
MATHERVQKIPRVLIVAGSDSGGGAGIQADLKTVSVFGAYGMTAITALTAQNTLGVFSIHAVPADFVRHQMEVCLQDIGADAVKTGMLANTSIVEIVAEVLKKYQVSRVVVDPVMVAKSGDPLLERDAVEALKRKLLPLATLITPNIPEAEVLCQRAIRSLEDMRQAVVQLAQLGPRYVVLKGGHLPGPAVDLYYDGKQIVELTAPRIETRNTHGTGCCFASAIAAGLARGWDVLEAARCAKEFITQAIQGGLCVGKGHGPANPLVWLGRCPPPGSSD